LNDTKSATSVPYGAEDGGFIVLIRKNALKPPKREVKGQK